MRRLWLATLLALVPGSAAARNVEPGEIWLNGGLGLDFKMGSRLGGSSHHLMLDGEGEYAFSKSLGAVGGINLGLADTKPLRLRLGARYRLTDLGLPVSPYGQVQLSVGKLFNVIGANLTVLSVYLGAGADYFLTAKLAAGARLGIDLGRTLGSDAGRGAFYGTFEVLATASYKF